MKNIYFVQACDVHGSGSNATAYLPYATGLLAAYAFHNETVKQNYRVKRFIYKKENIAEAVASLEAPAVVGFSTYIWNFEYNIAFASALNETGIEKVLCIFKILLAACQKAEDVENLLIVLFSKRL